MVRYSNAGDCLPISVKDYVKLNQRQLSKNENNNEQDNETSQELIMQNSMEFVDKKDKNNENLF